MRLSRPVTLHTPPVNITLVAECNSRMNSENAMKLHCMWRHGYGHCGDGYNTSRRTIAIKALVVALLPLLAYGFFYSSAMGFSSSKLF